MIPRLRLFIAPPPFAPATPRPRLLQEADFSSASREMGSGDRLPLIWTIAFDCAALRGRKASEFRGIMLTLCTPSRADGFGYPRSET